jgi:glycerol-3-phosphate dehydrogenase (NAD(P)+)
MNTVAIIGTGELGSALSKRFADAGMAVKYYDNDPTKPRNENSFEEAVREARVIFLCVPTRAIKETAEKIVSLKSSAVVVSLSKGMTSDGKTAAEILSETFGDKISWAVVGGPMIAEEIENGGGIVTAAIGSQSDKTAEIVGELFKKSGIDAVSNFDPFAVSFLGVLKNIYAVGMGILAGLNTLGAKKDAFVRTALAEMKKFCQSENFNPSIVDGPSGKGDLIETGNSSYSRNRAMGFELATVGKITTLGESFDAAVQFVKRFPRTATEMPILIFLAKVIAGKCPAKEIIGVIESQ